MPHHTAESILAHLRSVDAERDLRSGSPEQQAKVVMLKEFQQRRFAHSYSDLLRTTRYGAAARFFLDELYGPRDFTQRDAQFARVVPALVRLFPRDVVETVGTLAELHAVSESLDSAMAGGLGAGPLTTREYVRSWQRVGRAADRQRQITLTLSVADRLDRFTRKPLMRNSLRLMRGPARAAGLAELQRFLEMGFDTFRAMGGADEFMAIVQSREQALARALFSVDLDLDRDDVDLEVLAGWPQGDRQAKGRAEAR